MSKWMMIGALLFILSACSNQGWKESSLFESEGYTMIGNKSTVGFIYEDSDVDRFYPNHVQKYMWHSWGEDILSSALKIKATHEGTGDEIELVQANGLGGANNGADAHMPSSFSLPEVGMWKLDVYLNDHVHDSIFVEVHEEPA